MPYVLEGRMRGTQRPDRKVGERGGFCLCSSDGRMANSWSIIERLSHVNKLAVCAEREGG